MFYATKILIVDPEFDFLGFNLRVEAMFYATPNEANKEVD